MSRSATMKVAGFGCPRLYAVGGGVWWGRYVVGRDMWNGKICGKGRYVVQEKYGGRRRYIVPGDMQYCTIMIYLVGTRDTKYVFGISVHTC
jgi:hypothetical protein